MTVALSRLDGCSDACMAGPPLPGEASATEIAAALGVSAPAVFARCRNRGWPSRLATWAGAPRGKGKQRVFPLACLPERVRAAVLAARGHDPGPATDWTAMADTAEIAAALGVHRNTAASIAVREEWPRELVPRSERGLGRGADSVIFPLACLPRWVRIAVLDRRSPDPDEPCARCERQVPGNLLCWCSRCERSVCADCMDGEYCGSCRRELKARRRYSHRPRKAALALAANRAARGEGVPT